MPSVSLIRFAKLTVLIADIWTIFCAVLIVGWQITIFIRDGSWQALPLSLVFLGTGEYGKGDVFSTASIPKIEGSRAATSFVDVLLQMPIVSLSFLAAAFLTAFYLWLLNAERRLNSYNSF